MERKISIFFWGLTALALLLYASISIIKGGLFDLATAFLLISPFIFLVFLKFREYWHVLIPCFLVADALRIPIYGLRQATPILLLLLAVTVSVILNKTLRISTKAVSSSWEDRFVIILACILTARLIYDRPGLIGFGAQEGGLIRSLTYVMASWFYFPIKNVVASAKFTRRQLQVATLITFALIPLGLLQRREGVLITRYFGGPDFWMLCAMIISLLATSDKQIRQGLWFYFVSFVFMGVGIISTFRSRAFFFLGETLAVSWFMGRFRRAFLIVAGGSVFSILILSIAPGGPPEIIKRFLSLFVEIEGINLEGVVGAVGWQDSYRGELYELAWEHIKRRPVFGRGFGLSVSEAIGILTVGQRVSLWMLDLSASYHNSIVALAVISGVPAALLFTSVLLSTAIRFARMMFRIGNEEFRTWGCVIFAFWVANFFYILMNGGPVHYFNGMILSGFMMGMLQNEQAKSKTLETSDPTPENQKADLNSSCEV